MTDSSRRVTVAVADDHTLFRQGVQELLATDPDVRIVGEAATGPQAVELVMRHQPDVLLLDVEMPGPGAKAVIAELARTCPATAVVILTMHESSGVVSELLQSGAAAYLVKSIGRDELLATVHSVNRNQRNVLLSVPRTTMRSLERAREQQSLLSARETEVLELVAAALTNAQIAGRLFISEGTVKRHLTNIYGKLQATSRVDAIKKGTAAGLLRGIDEDSGV
ncbi:response regulator transcription factor [Actinophytocola oryzae]|uniref:LuxR family two component transcriptional regulator n=1 Tax=Actinophytocola oryzae TaxID=502181 RepID=A0A4R7VW27_9PSEU|nr:response regulator transcription factor [Actinophytocola oryzae]TDV54240.1 LuxR family two component transcriptional regulator [Actinophytocola oryzae]